MEIPTFAPERRLVPSDDDSAPATVEELLKRAKEQGFEIVKDDGLGFRCEDPSGAVMSSGAGAPVIGAARAIRRSHRGEL